MKFTTKFGWRPFHGAEMLRTSGNRWTFQFRAEADARIYVADNEEFVDEVLAAVGRGDLEVEVIGYGPLYVRQESEERVWLRSDEINQRAVPVYGTVFTEPMNRPQKSAEMIRIEQLLRANKLERDREMAAWQARLDEMERKNEDLRARAVSGGSAGVPEGSGQSEAKVARRAPKKGRDDGHASRKAAGESGGDVEPEASDDGSDGQGEPRRTRRGKVHASDVGTSRSDDGDG